MKHRTQVPCTKKVGERLQIKRGGGMQRLKETTCPGGCKHWIKHGRASGDANGRGRDATRKGVKGHRGSSLRSCTHLCSGGEIDMVGLYHEGLGVNLAQTLPQLRVLG